MGKEALIKAVTEAIEKNYVEMNTEKEQDSFEQTMRRVYEADIDGRHKTELLLTVLNKHFNQDYISFKEDE